jgi:hypothetical protein
VIGASFPTDLPAAGDGRQWHLSTSTPMQDIVDFINGHVSPRAEVV